MNTIDFAINMELEGQRFFEEQAKLNQDNELHSVFLILADAEKQHAELLKKRKELEPYTLGDNSIRQDTWTAITELIQMQSENKEKQLDMYRRAYKLEENSIQLYHDLMAKTSVPENIELYQFLIGQEKEHLKFFEDLVILLTRPEEWVESAEFGEREEY